MKKGKCRKGKEMRKRKEELGDRKEAGVGCEARFKKHD